MGTIQIAAQKPATAGKISTNSKISDNNGTNGPTVNGKSGKTDFLLSKIELFASSYGLKPYRALVIRDSETKRKLQSAGWNEKLSGSQSQLVVFAIEKEITKEKIDSYIAEIAGSKKVSAYAFLSYKKYLESHINHKDKEGKNWAAKQAQLAVGSLLTAAAELSIKAIAIEGEDAVHLDEILGFGSKKIRTVAAVIIQGGAGEAPATPQTRVHKQKELLEYI